jgi:hypothetical protein
MRRALSLACALLIVATAASVLAGAAGAKIVPQKKIAGIKLGMVRAAVVEKKGKPDSEQTVPHEILGEQRKMRYGKTKVFFAGTRANAGVIAVSTKAPRQRTNTGVGVGSTEREVKDGVNGVRCATEFGFRSCVKGRRLPGKRVTEFAISRSSGRVTSVLIGIVID